MLRAIFDIYLLSNLYNYPECFWYVLVKESNKLDQRSFKIDCKLMIRVYRESGSSSPSISISRNDYLVIDVPSKKPTLTAKVRAMKKLEDEMKKELLKIISDNLTRFTEEEKDTIIDELLKD